MYGIHLALAQRVVNYRAFQYFWAARFDALPEVAFILLKATSLGS